MARAKQSQAGTEMTAEARAAMFRCQRITREMYALRADESPGAQARYRALDEEKGRLLAITHADWLRRCRP